MSYGRNMEKIMNILAIISKEKLKRMNEISQQILVRD